MNRTAGRVDAPFEHPMHAGELSATFRPAQGMLGTSLKHRGEEILRFPVAFATAARNGDPIGLALHYPFANRIEGTGYRVLGRDVSLDPASPWVMTDANGVIVHGVRWALLEWELVETGATFLESRLRWDRPEWLAVFPFPHEVRLRATLDAAGLTVETTVHANAGEDVPASFGFHPCVGLPGVPRSQWRLVLPRMQALALDERLIPLGEREDFPAYDHRLADLDFDHGFAFVTSHPRMSIAAGDRRIDVEFLRGFAYAQIVAPPRCDHIAFEPMVAPANALNTGDGLPIVRAGDSYRAVFRIAVGSGADRRLH